MGEMENYRILNFVSKLSRRLGKLEGVMDMVLLSPDVTIPNDLGDTLREILEEDTD